MTTALEYVRYSCGIAGEEVADTVAALETEIELLTKQRDELLVALEDAVSVAKTTFDCWDSDADSKAGKYLMALSGWLPGYDGRTDAVHKAIASVKGIEK